MNQLSHISKNRTLLKKRAEIVRAVRHFFDNQGFIEIQAPALLALPGQEPYLSPMKVAVLNDQKVAHECFLHTSPEFTLKKTLASGFDSIYFLGSAFRNNESFGGTHNPEFTMLEWYRKGKDFYKIMDDIKEMTESIATSVSDIYHLPKLEILHMRDVFMDVLGINLDEHLTKEGLASLCQDLGISIQQEDAFEDLFYRIFLEKIEPTFTNRSILIHHYPMQMAALAKQSDFDPLYAERFEWYVNGMEIANAFSELCDANLQKERFLEDQQRRSDLGKEVFPIDEEFISALPNIGSAAGIALGVDRLVMAFTGCKNIDNVLVLPLSKQ